MAISALLAVGGASSWFLTGRSMLTDIDPAARAILTSPDSVACYRVTSVKRDKDGAERIYPPKRISNPVELSDAQVRRLVHALTKRGARDGKAACGPLPGIEYVFSKGGRVVSMALCFRCQYAGFRDGSDKGVGGSDFDHSKDELIALTMELFPNDPAIQQLASDRNASALEDDPRSHPPSKE